MTDFKHPSKNLRVKWHKLLQKSMDMITLGKFRHAVRRLNKRSEDYMKRAKHLTQIFRSLCMLSNGFFSCSSSFSFFMLKKKIIERVIIEKSNY